MVTRDQLQTFQQLQSQEMRTYVQAELAPVHSGIEVDGIQAFVQRDRYTKGGEFVSVFADLKLS